LKGHNRRRRFSLGYLYRVCLAGRRSGAKVLRVLLVSYVTVQNKTTVVIRMRKRETWGRFCLRVLRKEIGP
jgi:hypothetical protein